MPSISPSTALVTHLCSALTASLIEVGPITCFQSAWLSIKTPAPHTLAARLFLECRTFQHSQGDFLLLSLSFPSLTTSSPFHWFQGMFFFFNYYFLNPTCDSWVDFPLLGTSSAFPCVLCYVWWSLPTTCVSALGTRILPHYTVFKTCSRIFNIIYFWYPSGSYTLRAYSFRPKVTTGVLDWWLWAHHRYAWVMTAQVRGLTPAQSPSPAPTGLQGPRHIRMDTRWKSECW